MSDLLARVTALRSSFARRQSARTVEVTGGVAVGNPDFPASQEHNQLLVESPATAPAELPALAESGLGPRRQYRITVLDEAVGSACAPALLAAGYAQDTELVMARSTRGARLPEPAAQPVGLPELRPALAAQNLVWLPGEQQAELRRQLVDRRAVRRWGADKVLFLAVRTRDGSVAAWADLYLWPREGIAQLEDLATADAHTRQGHGDTLLATALALAAGAGCPDLFLIADAEDWPKDWYARRGFEVIGRNHSFLGSPER
ncbi:GNAT family N-acetyltransferase [Kitasatospora azatica]|uniref:GNAT family N-acetyltransferase n=1 Tax=Kitasatospora azatica TaxID=58347 RepID=UPI00056557FB|nr:GNAT family N-acetyltransferase [Kitasatospora azatica]